MQALADIGAFLSRLAPAARGTYRRFTPPPPPPAERGIVQERLSPEEYLHLLETDPDSILRVRIEPPKLDGQDWGALLVTRQK